MLTGNLPPASRRATYVETVELLESESPYDPIPLSAVVEGGTVELMGLDDTSETALISKTWGTDSYAEMTGAPGVVFWRFEVSDLEELPAGDYRLLATLEGQSETMTLI